MKYMYFSERSHLKYPVEFDHLQKVSLIQFQKKYKKLNFGPTMSA